MEVLFVAYRLHKQLSVLGKIEIYRSLEQVMMEHLTQCAINAQG